MVLYHSTSLPILLTHHCPILNKASGHLQHLTGGVPNQRYRVDLVSYL